MHRLLFIILCTLLQVLPLSAALAGQVDVGSSADTQVVEGNPASNYGSTTSMYVGSSTSGFLDERIWVKFDLANQLPPNAAITSARLLLYCWRSDGPTTIDATAHATTDGWTESGLTWATQPSFTGTALDTQTLTAGDGDRWFSWDVTPHVQAEYAGDGTVSLVVKATPEDQPNSSSYGFNGKEYSSSIAPRLRIEYNGDWPQTNTFKIFHVNDVHSRLVPHDFDFPGDEDLPVLEKAGGAAYLTAKMLELKAADPTSLVLDAGDVSEGSPLGDLRGNGGALDFFNQLDTELKALGGRGVDAMVVGNHDVRFQSYIDNMKSVNFPVISMNICTKGTQTPYFDAYTIITLENGVTVGVLGYTNDESSYLGDETGALLDVVKAVWNDEDSSTINIKDYVETLRTTGGCDVVVLLSHIGQSRIVSGSDALIEDSGGVDPPEVVVSGHWHTWTEKAWQPAQLNYKTTLVEAASYLQYIGELTVTGDGKYVDAAKHPIRCSQISPNANVSNLINTLIAEYNAGSPAYGLDQVIGYSATDLTMDKDKWWTVSEYPWNATNAVGAWVTDAMAWKLNANGIDADLAIQTGGSIRRDVARGAITYTEIYEAYPWQDDEMVQVRMTGQQIWDFIQADNCGTSISHGWKVSAEDGSVTGITLNDTAIGLTTPYNVIISDYMVDHEGDISFSNPVYTGFSIRQSVIDFTAQYTETSPMYPNGIDDRYDLDTELAGGFQAVVLFIADSENQPYHEDGFIRLLSATDDTLLRRNMYGLSDLVNSDGSVNKAHQFSDTMLYRGHLGFLDGKYQHGDIIEIRGEGGFYQGVPEFISEEGIVSGGVEISVLGHDESLALPEYMHSFDAFFDEWHENHYVKLYVEKTGANTARDAYGTNVTIYQADAYDVKTLPGNVGDILEITGVQTAESYTGRRFRCHTAVLASDQGIANYPPSSAVDAISPAQQTASPITLTATGADVASGSPGGGTVIAHTSFEEPGTGSQYTDTLDSGTSHALINNIGEAPVNYTGTGGELGFTSYYGSTGGTGLTDGDYVGVTDYTPLSGGSFTHGSQGFEMQDTDGIMTTTLDAVDISGYTTVTVSADLFVKADSWETADIIRIWAEVDSGTEIDLINTGGSDIDDLAIEGSWMSVAADLSGYTTATLHLSLEANAAGETIWIDNIVFTGDATGGSGSTVDPESVAFSYRYSPDGVTWGSWTLLGTDNSAPDGWTADFSYPDGYGYYEFYSKATDADGNVEDAPVRADASVRYVSGTNTAPNTAINPSIPDGSTDVNGNIWLTVTVGDTDNDPMDVCFYRADGRLIDCVSSVASGQTASVAWTGLSSATTYGWYTVINDGTTTTQSAPLTFTTTNQAPMGVNGAAVAGTTDATLSLTVIDADDGALLDVVFYDDNETTIGTVTGLSSGSSAKIQWDGLSAGTPYGWYAMVSDGIDSIETEYYSFTTTGPATPVPAASMPAQMIVTLVLLSLGMFVKNRP